MQVSANFGPRNGFYTTRTELGHPPLNFGGPCLFNPFVGRVFDALEQQTGQFGAVVGRKLRSLFVQLLDGATHDEGILPDVREVT